ncbi:hypothetical protein CD351_00875 [Erythrobacter sp. KY5]|nr:hypothetical protein CD351_00875 [Erythrobacter sp. KY5]
MTPWRSIVSLACSALLLTACGVDEVRINEPFPTPTPTPSPNSAASLPRLPAGPHLGMITGFDPLGAARSQIAQDSYAQARAAGASIGRVQIDWADLEPAQGQYDADALAEAFADPNLDGMNVVVLVSTLDSDGLTLPSYLQDGNDLRSGLTLASPEVTDAFAAFLGWLGPQLQQRDVWLLSIANEPLGPIEDGRATEADAVTFYSNAMDQWNTEMPEIGVTATFTIGGPAQIPNLFEAVRSRADIVSFNYYCLTADLFVTGQADWEARLAQMKADAGDREIFLQELGCPVGYGPSGGPSVIGGSLDNQAAFFEFFGETFATDPQMRAATAFQLFDWSPELAAMSAEPLRDAGLPAFADRFEEWLATVGLRRWSDGSERPAWSVWLDQLEKTRQARGQ